MPAIHLPNDTQEADRFVRALVSFLTEDSSFRPGPVGSDAIQRGERLFHTVGCAVCHGDQRISQADRPAFSVPLGDPAEKYSIGSLTGFLLNPHDVRPSGRMPSLNLSDEEAHDVASYLIREVDVDPNISYAYFEGDWQSLPDFTTLTPVASGGTTDFSARIGARENQFAVRFSGYLQIEEPGEYEFSLSSDDGSRLLVDGTEVLNLDGIHPADWSQKKVSLSRGPHPLVVEYFESFGEESLKLEIAGPGMNRQSAAAWMTITEAKPEPKPGQFVVDRGLVEEGRRLFDSLGCAACHSRGRGDNRIQWTGKAPAFAQMDPNKGCLSETPNTVESPDATGNLTAATESSDSKVPRFSFSQRQRSDLRLLIQSVTQLKAETTEQSGEAGISELNGEQRIEFTMTALNCYACHERNKRGGIVTKTDKLFTGAIPEMGDEGRLPPHLNGVGDKLNPEWLRTVLNEGARDRPYMFTRMPKFGHAGAGALAETFTNTDVRKEELSVEMQVAEHRYKADARHMIGDRALGCIKCHTFNEFKVVGVQAVNMTTMTKRLRREWFHRYLMNPMEYRPGTRMPTAWPNGRSVLPKILDGKPDVQIESIWEYLEDGADAKVPSGLQKQSIELKPTDRTIIYRNFIQGLSPRGIAVGTPEKAHFAWDAEEFAPRLIWHGAFIDAAMHWEGRGPGAQSPLGDHVMELPSGPPIAVLESLDSPWPTESPRDSGFEFDGYKLDGKGVPAFRYLAHGLQVTDELRPVVTQQDAGLLRTLTTSASTSSGDSTSSDGSTNSGVMYFRIAKNREIELRDGEWVLDQSIRCRFTAGQPLVRDTGDFKELLVPVESRIQYQMEW